MPVVLVVSAGGGHAAVVLEAAVLSGLEVAGFVTIETGAAPSLFDCPHLGGPERLQEKEFLRQVELAPACGSNVGRRQLATAVEAHGGVLRTVRHPAAIVSPSAVIEGGSVILAGAIVGPRARLGRGVILNHAASVDHDCDVGAFVNICPGARLAGAVIVEDDAFVGMNASVLQGRRVGRGAVIGAGAVVTRDVEPGAVFVGVPARQR
jgi:acetyltransferase EpsM